MKTVLITGASSGIGQQLAVDYVREGWHVIACGRNKEKLTAVVQQYGQMTPLCFDVTDLSAVKMAFQQLSSRPVLWIFNAGDCEYIEDGEIDSALFHRVMQTNFFGVVHCLEAVQSLLGEGDHVAVTGSIASEVPLPKAEAYGASKAALLYLLTSLQLNWSKRGIFISLIIPGFVATPLTQKNTFSMPMCISVEQASLKIRAGLAKRKARIYFPWVFTRMLRLIHVLPHSIQQFMIRHLIDR